MTATGYFAQYLGSRIIDITQEEGENVAHISTFGAHNQFDDTPLLFQYVEGITNINGEVFKIKVTGPSSFTIPLILDGSYVRGGTYFNAYMANHYIPV